MDASKAMEVRRTEGLQMLKHTQGEIAGKIEVGITWKKGSVDVNIGEGMSRINAVITEDHLKALLQGMEYDMVKKS